MRKATTIPYVSHLLAVASLVLEFGGDEDEAIAALLHDAVEDHGGLREFQQIRARFGERVATVVKACSDSTAEYTKKKAPWLERKRKYQEHLGARKDASVLLVSACDKLHNARATVTDIRNVGESVWERFNTTEEPNPLERRKINKRRSLANYEALLTIYQQSGEVRVRRVAAELQRAVQEMAPDSKTHTGNSLEQEHA